MYGIKYYNMPIQVQWAKNQVILIRSFKLWEPHAVFKPGKKITSTKRKFYFLKVVRHEPRENLNEKRGEGQPG